MKDYIVVNVNPRRAGSSVRKRASSNKNDPAPWKKGDPTRMFGLNTPVNEPLMLMLDFLVEQRIIYSKASFIREVVAKAAEEAIAHAGRVRAAVKLIEAKDKKR